MKREWEGERTEKAYECLRAGEGRKLEHPLEWLACLALLYESHFPRRHSTTTTGSLIPIGVAIACGWSVRDLSELGQNSAIVNRCLVRLTEQFIADEDAPSEIHTLERDLVQSPSPRSSHHAPSALVMARIDAKDLPRVIVLVAESCLRNDFISSQGAVSASIQVRARNWLARWCRII